MWRHRESLLVTMLGMFIFAALNMLMLQMDPERFTNPRFAAWTAFHKIIISGFDPYIYQIITQWNPIYEVYRHPLIAYYIWPLSELNSILKDTFDINCTIYIIAVLWTIVSAVSFTLLYRIMRRYVGVRWFTSLLLSLLFFSFSHVMMITFVPDHMLLTLFTLLLMVNITAEAYTKHKKLPLPKALLMYIASAGITTTNAVKIWMTDMAGRYDTSLPFRHNIPTLFRRSLWYLLPTLILAGAFAWQMDNSVRLYKEGKEHIISEKMKHDTVFAASAMAKKERDSLQQAEMRDKQLVDSKVFAYTDNSVSRLPLLYENIYGEGMLLHEDYLLQDANKDHDPRPVIVPYRHTWYYAVNAVVVALFLTGVWLGRRERLLWLVMPMFLFDMFLHAVLRFAATDVYIMTAHWAFAMPIAMAYLARRVEHKRFRYAILMAVILAVTIFLWHHNLTLIAHYITG